MVTRSRSLKKKTLSQQAAIPAATAAQLRRIVLQLNIVQAAIVCAGEVIRHQACGYDPEAALLLQRCASDPLHIQIEALTTLLDDHQNT